MFAYRCSGRDGGFGFGGKGFGILGVGMKGFGFRAAEFWGFGFQDEGVISRPQNFGLRLQGAKGTWVDVLGLGSAMSPVCGLRLFILEFRFRHSFSGKSDEVHTAALALELNYLVVAAESLTPSLFVPMARNAATVWLIARRLLAKLVHGLDLSLGFLLLHDLSMSRHSISSLDL